MRLPRTPKPDLFVISHSGARAGAPMVLLHFLHWMRRNTSVSTDVALLLGGTMEGEFAAFDARVLGGAESRLWVLQQGLSRLGQERFAAGLAFARLSPTMWARRSAPMILMNSVGSLPALQFLPEDSPAKIVLYVHEMEDSFARTIGERVWERLSPRVDHFIACAPPVEEMLVEQKGVDPERITRQPGFIEEPRASPLRSEYLRRVLGIPPDALVVGACGRPDWRKAPELFVRLGHAISRRRPDQNIHFVWLGGPMEGSPGWKLIHDYESAGLTGRFHLTGESRQPYDIMSLFDVFALTSREDPYPLAMLEAAALGVPIVAFANGGVTELAEAGGDRPLARVVPYLDVESMAAEVLDLADDPDGRRQMADRARHHVLESHLTDQAAPQLFDALARLEPRLAGLKRAVPTTGTSRDGLFG